MGKTVEAASFADTDVARLERATSWKQEALVVRTAEDCPAGSERRAAWVAAVA